MALDEIKKGVNLLEYAKNVYGYKCDSKGSGSCLFHPPDKHHSFSIFKDDNGTWRFKCFHDGTAGSIVDLKALMDGVTEEEAIKMLLVEFDEQGKMTVKTGSHKKFYYFYTDLDGNEIYRKVKLEHEDRKKTYK